MTPAKVRSAVGWRGPASATDVADYVTLRMQGDSAGAVGEALRRSDAWLSALRRRQCDLIYGEYALTLRARSLTGVGDRGGMICASLDLLCRTGPAVRRSNDPLARNVSSRFPRVNLAHSTEGPRKATVCALLLHGALGLKTPKYFPGRKPGGAPRPEALKSSMLSDKGGRAGNVERKGVPQLSGGTQQDIKTCSPLISTIERGGVAHDDCQNANITRF